RRITHPDERELPVVGDVGQDAGAAAAPAAKAAAALRIQACSTERDEQSRHNHGGRATGAPDGEAACHFLLSFFACSSRTACVLIARSVSSFSISESYCAAGRMSFFNFKSVIF